MVRILLGMRMLRVFDSMRMRPMVARRGVRVRVRV